MGFIDQMLFEFKGQLSYSEICNMTYKELGYLRKHRTKIREELAKAPMSKESLEYNLGS